MMKNLKKNVILSLVMTLALTLLLVNGANASGFFMQGGNVTGNALDNTSGSNATRNDVQKVNTVSNGAKDPQTSPTPTATPTTTPKPTPTPVENNDEPLPQTGENDIYIITAIGAVAIVIGGFAYIKSRKYNIK